MTEQGRHLGTGGAVDEAPSGSIIPQLELTYGDVTLWPVRPVDHEFLYWIATCDQNAYRWRFRGNVPPFEVFQSGLHAGVLAQFVVHSQSLGRRIGHVVGYDADLSAGHVHLAALVDPNYMYVGLGRDALGVFTQYLFDTWAFGTVFCEVPDYLVELFNSSEGLNELLPFQEVGRLPRYLFHKGSYHDMVIFALRREDFTPLDLGG